MGNARPSSLIGLLGDNDGDFNNLAFLPGGSVESLLETPLVVILMEDDKWRISFKEASDV